MRGHLLYVTTWVFLFLKCIDTSHGWTKRGCNIALRSLPYGDYKQPGRILDPPPHSDLRIHNPSAQFSRSLSASDSKALHTMLDSGPSVSCAFRRPVLPLCRVSCLKNRGRQGSYPLRINNKNLSGDEAEWINAIMPNHKASSRYLSSLPLFRAALSCMVHCNFFLVNWTNRS